MAERVFSIFLILDKSLVLSDPQFSHLQIRIKTLTWQGCGLLVCFYFLIIFIYLAALGLLPGAYFVACEIFPCSAAGFFLVVA